MAREFTPELIKCAVNTLSAEATIHGQMLDALSEDDYDRFAKLLLVQRDTWLNWCGE